MNSVEQSMPRQAVISVSELNRSARQMLEQGFPLLWVNGEISNFKRYDSGHWYFSLKDAAAQVRCVMFRHKNQYVDWQPQDGVQVEVRALVTLYEPRGDFQLNVEAVRRAGLGALYEAFEKLKSKLEKEGLFDRARKKAVPAFPTQIGIVTSPAAAALRDALTTLRRRMPSIPVVLYPTPVQGEGAAEKIAAAIRSAGRRAECNVLILCRGGGSIEDLWAFNEEVVARAIHECPIPIVTGIGHEIDFTISDFVADVRAPTPTAAAQVASPDREELAQRLASLRGRLARAMGRGIEARMQRLDILSRGLTHPGERLRNQFVHLAHFQQRLRSAWLRAVDNRDWWQRELTRRLVGARPDLAALIKHQENLGQRMGAAAARFLVLVGHKLKSTETHLTHLDPHRVLERGYSIAQKGDGAIVRNSTQVEAGDSLRLTFAAGWANTEVKDKGR